MPGYRIGYLNPWTSAAENHACASLQIAAQRIGHEIIPATNSDELLAANLDFVIAVASTQPRTTHLPTFANIHEARTRWWESESYFSNLLTYDGYLTISDTLLGFIRSFASGFGKNPAIGEFFSSPQRQQLRADLVGLGARNGIRLCYFGTNWDPRARPLFRELARRSYMQVRGPEHTWQHIPREAYFGSVPFDGQSVQSIYAANGAGLVVHSRNHTIDDIVSNRTFEICSVGAAVVAPEMPWLRSRFGDALHYYDPWAPANEVVRRIDEIMEDIRENPVAAAEMADMARSTFERRYCAEVLLANTVKYFEGWKVLQAKLREAEQPSIDVIVRVGGRPFEVVQRAIKSIDAQSTGRFRVIFVRYKPFDLSHIIEATWENIEEFEVVDSIGGNRSKTMAAGLANVKRPYFGVLDDDDFWLPDHAASMWRVLKPMPREAGFAYCGLITVDESPNDGGPPRETRKIANLKPASGTIWDIVGKFGSINWLASSALLDGLPLEHWALSTAEDTLTVCHLLAAAPKVQFTWRATVCISQGGSGSGFAHQGLQRKEDILEAFLRIGPGIEEIERKFPRTPSETWAWLGTRVAEVFEAKTKAAFREDGLLVLEEGMLGCSIHDRDDVVATEIWLDPSTMSVSGAGYFAPAESGSAVVIVPPQQPWAYGATIDVQPWLLTSEQQWIVLEFDHVDGAFGVGLLKSDGTDFYSRTEVPSRKTPIELWIYVGNRHAISQLVMQNWGTFEGNKATLRKMWAVRRK